MLMDMVDGFELEVRDALTPKEEGGGTVKNVIPGSKEAALADMGVSVLKQGLTKGPLSHDPEWFNKDDNYATAVQQAPSLAPTLALTLTPTLSRTLSRTLTLTLTPTLTLKP